MSELERVGLVERLADPGDGRATLARITSRRPRRTPQDAAPVYLAGIDEHFNRHLTAARADAVAKGLQRVVDAHDVDPRR